MKRVTAVWTLALVILLANQALAEVPKRISYQGRISVAGKAYDGKGLFKFALVAGSGVNVWSNDGSALGTTSAPTAGVEVPVAKGVYSVLLGDSRLGMPAIEPEIFADYPAVRIRTWFNDGTHGFQQLSPDFPLVSVPYAMVAAHVPCNTITPCNLGAGTVKGEIVDCTGSAPLDAAIIYAEGTSAMSIASGTNPHNYELTYVPAGTHTISAMLPAGKQSKTLAVSAGDVLTDVNFYVGASTFYADDDGDGFGDPDAPIVGCEPTAGYVANSNDCDDSDHLVGEPQPCTVPNRIGACSQGVACPGEACVGPEPEPEVCDGADNDCDGQIDEGVSSVYYFDADGDHFGDPTASIIACSPPPGYVSDASDCDDTLPDVNPQALELCDGLDNDCDGNVDEDYAVGTSCSAGVGACAVTGQAICSEDGTGVVCSAEPPSPTTEVCDGVDNDCDGSVDEDFQLGAACNVGVGACSNSGMIVCSDQGGAECSAEPYPPEQEICDGIDNDCDGSVDEEVSCDDGDPCTADTCDGADGCAHTAIAGCVSCTTNADCDDADVCTTDICTAEGACEHQPLNCDDGDPCTADSCDPNMGCTHTPIAGCVQCTTNADCDDGNPCSTDYCDPQLGCVNTFQDGLACDDGDACTVDDACEAGVCAGQPISCDDGNPNTIDYCDPEVGCVHK